MALINTTTTGVLGTTLFGDGAGALTVQKDGVTQGVYGNIPAFSVYSNATQSISATTFTKISWQVKEFDTASCFDTTNYRFIPNVAGYYFFTSSVYTGGPSSNTISIYKNGSEAKRGPQTAGAYMQAVTVSALIYANGTTDYFEIYDYGAAHTVSNSIVTTYFQGYLVKAV